MHRFYNLINYTYKCILYFQNLDSAEKLAYVGDIRQAIRFVQGDLKGKPLLPGLCTSKVQIFYI